MGSLARILVFTVGASLGLSACAAGAAPRAAAAAGPAQPTALCPVTGVVVNGVNAKPLVGAIIDLDGRPRAESGPGGRFRIDDVPVGPHLLAFRAAKFRAQIQQVTLVVPDPDEESGRRNDFIVLLFSPSAYFDTFPRLANSPLCLEHADCPSGQVCLMNNFQEADAPTCTVPRRCATEADCKLGQRCEPVPLRSGAELRVCHGQPAPEVEP